MDNSIFKGPGAVMLGDAIYSSSYPSSNKKPRLKTYLTIGTLITAIGAGLHFHSEISDLFPSETYQSCRHDIYISPSEDPCYQRRPLGQRPFTR